MISAKLVQLIEDHADNIADQVVRRLREDPRLEHLGRLPQAELRGRCQEILKRLGHWLAASDEKQIADHFETVGRSRAEGKIPLHEVVLGLQILKERMLAYIRDQGISSNTVELYAEEELELQLGRFFDSVVYHVVIGYGEWFGVPRPSAVSAAG